MTAKIACTDEDDSYVTKDMGIISIPICMIIDMMAFTGAYGHKTMLETKRTNPAFRDAFRVYSTEMASGLHGRIFGPGTQRKIALRQRQVQNTSASGTSMQTATTR